MNPDDKKLPPDEQRVITLGMMGFVYLSFLVGAGMILFGPAEKVNDSRINLIIVGPLLVALGYITGRRGGNTDTQGGANVSAPGSNVFMPPAAPSTVPSAAVPPQPEGEDKAP